MKRKNSNKLTGNISSEKQDDIIQLLFQKADADYQKFVSRLIPNVESERIIGVRSPQLRQLLRQINKEEEERFLAQLPHRYHEENLIHQQLLSRITDFETAITEVNRFLPYIDNWAVCDSQVPKAFYKNLDKLYPYVVRWINSNEPYTIRYGLGTLMRCYLDEAFKPEQLELVIQITNQDYYVQMMQAWYLATALAKQYSATILLLENNSLPLGVHNKTIQKAVESFRITPAQKDYLKTLRRKQ